MWQKFWNAKPVVLLLLQDFAESNTTLSQPPCAILHSSILSVSDIASISSNPSIDSSTCLLNSPFQCNIAFTAILLSMTEKTISTYTILVVLIFGLLVRPDHAASLLLSIKLQVPPTFLAPEGDFLHRLDNSHPHSASPSRKKYLLHLSVSIYHRIIQLVRALKHHQRILPHLPTSSMINYHQSIYHIYLVHRHQVCCLMQVLQ